MLDSLWVHWDLDHRRAIVLLLFDSYCGFCSCCWCWGDRGCVVQMMTQMVHDGTTLLGSVCRETAS